MFVPAILAFNFFAAGELYAYIHVLFFFENMFLCRSSSGQWPNVNERTN